MKKIAIFPHMGEMQRPDVRPHQVRQPFISRSRARCNDQTSDRIKYVNLSFPAHGRDATKRRRSSLWDSCLSFPAHGRDATPRKTPKCGKTSFFHFPPTGEMQRYARNGGNNGNIFISRPRARCNRCCVGALTNRERLFISRPRARCNI